MTEFRSAQYQVAFDDTDAGGIVFFGNYFRIAHRALEAYVPSIGIPWPDWFSGKLALVPLRHAGAEYFHPLFAGETYTVKIQVAHLGTSSVTFSYEIFNGKDQLTTKLTTTHVFINRETKQKFPIPPELKGKLERQLTSSHTS